MSTRWSWFAVLFASCLIAASGALAADGVRVAVSIAPQKHFVKRIGGERVSVTTMVRPGQSPHTYEPSPRQMSEIGRSQVYFRIGVGFEQSWMERIRDVNPQMQVVDLREGIELRDIEGHHHGDGEAGHGEGHGHEEGHDPGAEHGHGEGGHEAGEDHEHALGERDPHVWTSPRHVITLAATIRDTLIELDPDGAEGYRERYEAYRDELEALDAEIEEALEGIEARRFMVYHPSWGYFADRYGLEQMPIELGGREPGAASLARVIDRAREEGVRVIFVQPQFSERNARTVAGEIDGEVVPIDPLAENYEENLRAVAAAFREAMQ